MNSQERKAARRKRREEERARKREERLEGCTLDAVADPNNLYKAAKQAARGVGWKASTQRYQKDVLRNVMKTRRDLLEHREVCRGFNEFDVMERGKLRHISSVQFSERVVHKSLSQNALIPAMSPSFVHSNSANMKGRGTSYAIKLMKRQLARHYRRHGTEGYILQIDFADYFASISHGQAKRLIASALDDADVADLACHLLDAQGEVGLGLGSEPNQILAVAFPGGIDHFVTEMCGVEAYGRYMDDSYAISTDKETLHIVLAVVRDKCAALGIEVNERKTRITKLTRGFTFLKKRFFYGENGRIVVKPCRDSITRERRKLKRQRGLVERGEMTYEQVYQSYQSWRGSMAHLDAHRTVLAMDALFAELFGGFSVGGGSS